MKDSGVPWLGEVPAHWSGLAIRRYCRVFAGATPSRAVPAYWQGGTIPWLVSGDVNMRRIRSARQFITDAGFAASSTKWIRPGSLIVALAGQGRTKGMIADVECSATCNQSLAAIEPSTRISLSRFLGYYLESRYLDLRALVGDGLRDGLNLEHIRSIPTPVPPLPEQAAIVRFLDHADRRMRRYMRAKQKLIKLLEEQKRAIIHRAVTRGLDPNVRLKPSGVEWLGEVPEHWGVRQVRRLSSLVTSGSRGWAAYYADDGDIFIQSGNLGRSMSLDFSYTQHVKPPSGAEGVRTSVEQNDVLVCITGALTGNVVMVDVELPRRAFVNQHVALLRPRPDAVLPRYLAFVLSSEIGKPQFNASEYGGTKQGLGLDDVRSAVITLPPLAEQNAVCARLDESLARIGSAADTARRELDLLREYRTRLIADAVTGKLDVREAAARLPIDSAETEPVADEEALADGDSDAGDDGIEASEEAAAALDE